MNGDAVNEAAMASGEISVRDLAALGDVATIVDVREPAEWDEAHIAHARLVPLATVPDTVDAFAATPTYVICRSGGRSARACEYLAAHGAVVVNVVGGMLAWQDAGLPVSTGPGATGA
jgi:rhodanese-related sulfurtransferase